MLKELFYQRKYLEIGIESQLSTFKLLYILLSLTIKLNIFMHNSSQVVIQQIM